MIPLHRCVCIWTTFLVCFVVVVFVWLLGRFGCPSGWVPTYLGQLWMTLDNNNNNNIHSMVVGDVGSSGSRYVNVRRDLPRLLFFVPYFFCQMYEFTSCRVSRRFIQCSSFPYKLRSISGAFFFLSGPD